MNTYTINMRNYMNAADRFVTGIKANDLGRTKILDFAESILELFHQLSHDEILKLEHYYGTDVINFVQVVQNLMLRFPDIQSIDIAMLARI